MPQVFHVLRCYECLTFQVHQVKKSSKWTCKMCDQKQSIKKVYGEGSGLDCRCHVQRLNKLRGEQLEEENRRETTTVTVEYASSESNASASLDRLLPETSRWTDFLEKPDVVTSEDDDSSMALLNPAVLKRKKLTQRVGRKKNVNMPCQDTGRTYPHWTKMCDGPINNNFGSISTDESNYTLNNTGRRKQNNICKTNSSTPSETEKHSTSTLNNYVLSSTKVCGTPTRLSEKPYNNSSVVNSSSKWSSFVEEEKSSDSSDGNESNVKIPEKVTANFNTRPSSRWSSFIVQDKRLHSSDDDESYENPLLSSVPDKTSANVYTDPCSIAVKEDNGSHSSDGNASYENILLTRLPEKPPANIYTEPCSIAVEDDNVVSEKQTTNSRTYQGYNERNTLDSVENSNVITPRRPLVNISPISNYCIDHSSIKTNRYPLMMNRSANKRVSSGAVEGQETHPTKNKTSITNSNSEFPISCYTSNNQQRCVIVNHSSVMFSIDDLLEDDFDI